MVERPSLIVMHGGPGFDHSTMRPWFDRFADTHQVIYLDHRGNGRSGGDLDSCRLDQWGDDVKALCDALGISRPAVLGLSFGGMVAMAYAGRHPGHPAKLVLASTAARMNLPATLAMMEELGGERARSIAERFWSEPTAEGAAEAIRRSLRGRVYDPQVTVSVLASAANSVTVIGEVHTAGRFPLSPNSDRLLDIVALAGGPTRPPGDLAVAIVRGPQAVTAPWTVLMSEPEENVRLAPGDQVRLLYRPRKFSTFGAIGKSQQISIEDDELTLAGAIGRTGGLDTNGANPASVLLFRFERPEVAARLGVTLAPGAKGVPVVYRLNLRDPAGYLIANSFNVQADDLLYAPRADAAELRKFLELVNTAAQIGYDVRVTSILQ